MEGNWFITMTSEKNDLTQIVSGLMCIHVYIFPPTPPPPFPPPPPPRFSTRASIFTIILAI